MPWMLSLIPSTFRDGVEARLGIFYVMKKKEKHKKKQEKQEKKKKKKKKKRERLWKPSPSQD